MKTNNFCTSTIKGTIAGAFIFAFTGAVPALAHDVWTTVDKAPDGKFIVDVGLGDRDDRSVPDPEKIVALDVVGSSGVTHLRRPLLKVKARMGQPTIETQPIELAKGSIIALTYDNGFFVTPAGEKGQINTTILTTSNVSDQHWTIKYSKMLFGPDAYLRKTNQRAELIALKDPFTLKRGEALPVRAEYEGKPLVGTEVQYDDGISAISDANSPKVKTGPDGVATIPLDRVGPYLLSVDLNEPAQDKRFATYDHVFGSMSFDLTK